MNTNSDLNVPYDKGGDSGQSLPDTGRKPQPYEPQPLEPAPTQSPEEALPPEPAAPAPESELPEQPEEDVPESEAPQTEPEESMPAETQQAELYTEVVQYELQQENNEESAMGFWPTVLLGFLLGAALCALICAAVSWIMTRPKKSSGLGKASISGVVAQGIGSREDQQDALFLSDTSLYAKQGVLMCVADGMGGLMNGGMYSSTAVSAAAKQFISGGASDPQRLVAELTRNAVAEVNRAISPNFGSGGTTFLLGLLYEGRFYFSSIGDSRICLCRDGQLIRLNRQHSFGEELMLHHINDGLSYDSARYNEKSGALTSYLGMGTIKYVDIPDHGIDIRRGDRFVLMSDGVFNALSDVEIAAILSLEASQISDRLKRAVEGKHMMYQDNYSAVVVVVE